MVEREEDAFRYISYVTLREAWTETKSLIIGWLILSIVCIIFGVLFEAGADATETIWSGIPKPLLYFLAFAGISWLMRGETIRFDFPRTFRIWLLVVTIVGAITLAASLLPTWAMIPVYLGIVLFVSLLDELSRIGKENHARLHPDPRGDDDDDRDEA